MKTGRKSVASRESSERADIPTLPVWKAYIVQFSRDTRATGGAFAGRIEHMSSGRRSLFHSGDELMAALRTMIDQLGDEET